MTAWGVGFFLVAFLAFINDQVPAELKGTISGAFYLFWGLGYFLGPMVLGRIGDAGYFLESFVSMGLLYLVTAVLLLWPDRGKIKMGYTGWR